MAGTKNRKAGFSSVIFCVVFFCFEWDISTGTGPIEFSGEMAVVSSDHADESLCAEGMTSVSSAAPAARLFTAEDIESNNKGKEKFLAVVDGFVVDASKFLKTHPGGLRKLLSANNAGTGATGKS